MSTKYSHQNIFFLFSAWLLLSFAAGFRWLGQDRDFDNYLYFYDSISDDLLDAFTQFRYEPGFVLLGWISRFFFDIDFNSFLFVCAAISLGIIFYIFNLRSNTCIVIILYLLILYPLHVMTQVRLALALPFLYLSLEFLSKNKIIAYFLLSIGILFHYSLIFFIPIFFIPTKSIIGYNNNLFKLIIYYTLILFVFVFLYFCFDFIYNSIVHLNPVAVNYFNVDEYKFNYFSMRSICYIILTIIGILVFSTCNGQARIHIAASIYGTILAFIIGLHYPVFAHRLFEITMFSFFLWIPCTSRNFFITSITILSLFAAYSTYGWFARDFFI